MSKTQHTIDGRNDSEDILRIQRGPEFEGVKVSAKDKTVSPGKCQEELEKVL